MIEKEIRYEIHDMSNRIKELQNTQNTLTNGQRYSLDICFVDTTNHIQYPIDIYSFECHSAPIIKLESYQYSNQDSVDVDDDIKEITITNPVCLLNFSYTQNDGDALKYYYFELSDEQNKLLGRSQKIYASSQIAYGIENYNNLQTYKLTLYCLTQSSVLTSVTYIFHTDYNKESIYADISFDIDKSSAVNNISISVTQLNGSGENYSFDDNAEYVAISDNGYVDFVDTYQTISKNFLCRIWCRNLNHYVPILKIQKTDDDGYIEVVFTGQNFIAYKHSCDIVTAYTSNYLVENGSVSENQDIYFAIGYYDGRIEMYTVLLN